jgi:ComF family protein
MKLIDLPNLLLDVIFPKFCINCQREGGYICKKCLDQIPHNQSPACYICGKRTDWSTCSGCQRKTPLKGIIAVGRWESILLRQIIYEYKYRFIKELSKILGLFAINYITNIHKHSYINDINSKTLINNDTILIPVPLHLKRFQWRGFNQSELLANEISEYFNVPVSNILTRTRNTLPQAEIKKQTERRKNAFEAFSLSPSAVGNELKNKTVVIIDDVCTTGSTLEECAKTLLPLGPKEIWGLVLARG